MGRNVIDRFDKRRGSVAFLEEERKYFKIGEELRASFALGLRLWLGL